jgi:uncharacterized RDD family membrane protein YckC
MRVPNSANDGRSRAPGFGIHWPEIDEDLSTEGLLPGAPAPRSTARSYFWERFIASLLDGMLYFPITIPATLVIGYAPVPLAVGGALVIAPVTVVYTSYCHGRWGKTLGKHLVGLVVRREEDDGPIGYGRAIRRDAPAMVFGIAAAALTSWLITSDRRDGFRMFNTFDDSFEQARRNPDEEPSVGDAFEGYGALSGWQWTLMALNWAWFVAEVSTMLLNDRRRAIHDVIGGTVVVKASALQLPPLAPADARAS